MERSLARCRILLSVLAMLAVFIDPTRPMLTRWLPLTGGLFNIHPYTLIVMGSHLAYSVTLYVLLVRGIVTPLRLATVATWVDVLFGAAIALVTEGATSPFYAFFAFAVLAVGLRAGLRATLVVTGASVALYLCLVIVSAPHATNFYIMRPAYLAITGYLVGYLGQERLRLEAKIRDLEATAERERIARSLHDGYAQTLAGVNLRIETCRELLRRGRPADALAELSDLQIGVNREHDALRAYIRSLVDLEPTERPLSSHPDTVFTVGAEFSGSRALVEHVLQIMLEGVRNVGRHAHARAATVRAAVSDTTVRIVLEDDGVGFPPDAKAPWSIASRAAEFDGRVQLRARATGAQLVIELPLAS